MTDTVTRSPILGTATTTHPDRDGRRIRYDVYGKRGFGDQRMILIEYRGHIGTDGNPVSDPDARPVSEFAPRQIWASAKRFNVFWNPVATG
jgi:hypothetical protein